MFDAIPSPLQHNIVDHLGSPKSRQSLAQTNSQLRRCAQETDAAFYGDWLKSDFSGNAPSEQGAAKAQYRDRLETSQQEKVRLLEIAAAGDARGFAANINAAHVRHNLSNRYGKVPVACAGLRIVEHLAQPIGLCDSPPRLREGELPELVEATRALHALAGPPISSGRQFSADLEAAALGAAYQANQANQASTPKSEPPPAPKRKSRAKQCTPGQHQTVRRILGFALPASPQH